MSKLSSDPQFVRMSFGVQKEPGAYALLLGSGTSRAAGIPTGWDITIQLVRDLAARLGDNPRDPAAWYADKYGKDLQYDEVIEMLGKAQADRQALISPFFEPTQDDLKNGLKIPGTAHKAISQLVRNGFVKVVLTTNFDRLLESALQAEHVPVNVVNGHSGIEGARSFASEPCTVIKINGDYKDVRILNSPDELNHYPEQLSTYIGSVLDAFGLIICGWSAQYDVALADLLKAHPNLRYGTYWLTRGDLTPEAQTVIAARKADVIQIDGADDVFQSLAEAVLTTTYDISATFDAGLMAKLVGEYANDPTKENRLSELLVNEARRVAKETPTLPTEQGLTTPDDVQHAVDSCTNLMNPITTAAAKLAYIGLPGRIRWISKAIEIVGQACLSKRGDSDYYGLSVLPATMLCYGTVLGALLGDNQTLVAPILLTPRLRLKSEQSHWETRFGLLKSLAALQERKLIPNSVGKKQEYMAGILLRDSLKKMNLDELADSEEQFDSEFEVAEYLVGLIEYGYDKSESSYWGFSLGTLAGTWSFMADERSRQSLLDEIDRLDIRSALSGLGFGQSDPAVLTEMEQGYRKDVVGRANNSS
jgi:hypothetical protein